jgi:hypothetical protein
MTELLAHVLREHAEQQYASELTELAAVDKRQRPPSWKLSPWAVMQYLMGGKLENGFEITPKYIKYQSDNKPLADIFKIKLVINSCFIYNRSDIIVYK